MLWWLGCAGERQGAEIPAQLLDRCVEMRGRFMRADAIKFGELSLQNP
ncbi:MAG: hypothetical protein AAF291_04310 [Pseudomonadota bacterium]